MKLLILLLFFCFQARALEISIVPEKILITPTFKGDKLTISVNHDYQEGIILLIKGPALWVKATKKKHLHHTWLINENKILSDRPSLYIVGANFPNFEEDFSYLSKPFIEHSEEFSQAFNNLQQQNKLYQHLKLAQEQRNLTELTLDLPSSIAAGEYTIFAYVVVKSKIIDSAYTKFRVEKHGLVKATYNLYQNHALIYAMLSLLGFLLIGYLSALKIKR